MEYLLTVLTNGRADCLDRTLAAFRRNVSPAPAEVFVYDDASSQLGMCAAHRHCWQAAAASEYEWVFHLEDDMLILCPIDLRKLRDVLCARPRLEAMTLLRAPVGAEVAHGGFMLQSPSFYQQLHTPELGSWVETARNWSCAPTLFRASLARDFDWSPEPGCETELGPRIQARYADARFGIWGGGEIHVAHIGVERAPGAKGY